MRLFFAAAVPGDVRAVLVGRAKAISPMGPIRWSDEASLHVTLRFLGETPDNRLSVVDDAATGATIATGFRLRVEKGGVFPSFRAPRIFWAGVTGDLDRLRSLASDLESRLSRLGFPAEERRYFPHLTLGRTPAGVRLDAAASENFLTALNDFRSAPFDVKEFHLFRSHLTPTGSRYEIVRTYPLG